MEISHAISFLVAAVVGTLVSESIAFGENQKKYQRGMDRTNAKKAWSHQLNNYFIDRADNLLKTFGIGIVLAFVLGSVANTDQITNWLLEKFGFEGVTLSLSGAALCAVILSFGNTIGKKIGLIKEDKTEE